MEESVKTHKRKSKKLLDPGDLVSDQSLEKNYKILGKVIDIEDEMQYINCFKLSRKLFSLKVFRTCFV